MVATNVQLAFTVLLAVLSLPPAQLEPIPSFQVVKAAQIAYLVKLTGIMICLAREDAKSVVLHQLLMEALTHVNVLVPIVTLLKV